MKRMATFSHQKSTVVSGELASRAGPIELDSTNATDFILRHVPAPSGDRVPLLDPDFHRSRWIAYQRTSTVGLRFQQETIRCEFGGPKRLRKIRNGVSWFSVLMVDDLSCKLMVDTLFDTLTRE